MQEKCELFFPLFRKKNERKRRKESKKKEIYKEKQLVITLIRVMHDPTKLFQSEC